MFDNRWDNWAGDFSESFDVGSFAPAVRDHVPEILGHFGTSVRKVDPSFPDEVRPGTFAAVMSGEMLRLSIPDAARDEAPEVIARFLEYLQESGRVGEGNDWAAQIRIIGRSYRERLKPGGGTRGVTIRKPAGVTTVGRNDPCPCGSGKKYKKCCYSTAGA